MINPVVLPGILNAHHIANRLHHTDSPVVTVSIGTDRACIGIGNHHAGRTILNIIPQMHKRICEVMNVL